MDSLCCLIKKLFMIKYNKKRKRKQEYRFNYIDGNDECECMFVCKGQI